MSWNYLCNATVFAKCHPWRFATQTSMRSDHVNLTRTELHWLGQNSVRAKFMLMQICWRTDTQRNSNILYEITYFAYSTLHLLLLLPNEAVLSCTTPHAGNPSPLFNIYSLVKFQSFNFSRTESPSNTVWSLDCWVFLMECDRPQKKRK